MSKVMRVFGTTGLAAVAAGALFFGATVASADTPDAPSVIAGAVTLDGETAPVGTFIEARIAGGATCATDFVGPNGAYVINFPAYEPDQYPCGGSMDDDILFYVNGNLADESPDASWNNTIGQPVNLDAESQAPAPTATTPGGGGGTGTPAATAVKTNTPGAPATGEGFSSGGDGASASWALALLGVGAVAFGAAGVTVARRSR